MTSAEFTTAANQPMNVGSLGHRFTIDQYHRMAKAGVFADGDRVELLDGWIVDMNPIGPGHAFSGQAVANELRRVLPDGWILRIQYPITLQRSEPIPDIVIARGDDRRYAQRHPGADDIALVVEVADSSVLKDRQAKGRIYAAAGIGEYWIVNLQNRKLEVYRQPRSSKDVSAAGFEQHVIIPADGRAPLTLDGKHLGEIEIAAILP